MRSTMLAITLCGVTGSLVGCGGSGVSECLNPTGTSSSKFVLSSLLLPPSRMDYAKDLNGDGRNDNQLGNIVGVLSQQGLGAQDSVTESVTKGTIVVLLNESSSDATFQADDCASTSIQVGNATTTPPTFGGTDTFTVDSSIPTANFKGSITAGTFRSNSPVTTTSPVTYTIAIPLISGAPPIQLTLHGAYIQYTLGSNGKISAGQINGAIKDQDVKANIIPTIATLLDSNVTTEPTSDGSKQLLSLFDTGGVADASCAAGTCKNTDGTCAGKMDGRIAECEVLTNSLIAQVLAPDVQMFDAQGNYAPNKENKTRDSLSLGLGFEAVKASF